jgi:hypothetical protein
MFLGVFSLLTLPHGLITCVIEVREMKRKEQGEKINSPSVNGSWNIYKTVIARDGLVDEGYALEIETEGSWQEPVTVSLESLHSLIPVEAAVLLVEMIKSTPEPTTVIYGDGIDIPEVIGWSLEFSALPSLTPASLTDSGTKSEPDEPEIHDEVLCCPDCERPNQFGELCPSCTRERD